MLKKSSIAIRRHSNCSLLPLCLCWPMALRMLLSLQTMYFSFCAGPRPTCLRLSNLTGAARSFEYRPRAGSCCCASRTTRWHSSGTHDESLK